MAVQGSEVELLGEGLQSASSVPGAFALNMIWREDAWQVRKGFGQVNQFTTTMSVNPNDGATPSTDWGYQEHLGSMTSQHAQPMKTLFIGIHLKMTEMLCQCLIGILFMSQDMKGITKNGL